MAPISQFISVKKVYGPDIISRFNLYTSMKVMVAPASGYTSGQALKAIAEVAKKTCLPAYGYELGGMAREEAQYVVVVLPDYDLRAVFRIRLLAVECTVRELHSSVVRIVLRSVRSVG